MQVYIQVSFFVDPHAVAQTEARETVFVGGYASLTATR